MARTERINDEDGAVDGAGDGAGVVPGAIGHDNPEDHAALGRAATRAAPKFPVQREVRMTRSPRCHHQTLRQSVMSREFLRVGVYYFGLLIASTAMFLVLGALQPT
jgi:hypothetical protein